MIRRSPAEHYFRYLVAHPGCYDNKYIKDIAAELKLDYLGDWYIEGLRNRVMPPQPFFPEDDTHAPSFRFLVREGLQVAFQPNRGYKEALRILAKPRWRELVESMLLSGASHEIIAHAVQVRMKSTMSPAGIQQFKYYFWNVDLLESLEMRALLELRNSGHFTDESEPGRVQHLALRALRHTDPRAVAARLPSSPLASLVSQMEMGVMPRKIDISEVVNRTMEAALTKTFAAVMQGGPMGVQMAQGYSMVAEAMGRLKQTVSNPEDALREDLRKIGVATTPNKVPTLQQLTGGNHTLNVHPEPVEVETTGEEVDDGPDAG